MVKNLIYLVIVHIVVQNLNMNSKSKICEECNCKDSKDNPIIEEFNGDYLVKSLCMMCYAKNIDENTNTYY